MFNLNKTFHLIEYDMWTILFKQKHSQKIIKLNFFKRSKNIKIYFVIFAAKQINLIY